MTVSRRLRCDARASQPSVLDMKASLDKAGIAADDQVLRQAAADEEAEG